MPHAVMLLAEPRQRRALEQSVCKAYWRETCFAWASPRQGAATSVLNSSSALLHVHLLRPNEHPAKPERHNQSDDGCSGPRLGLLRDVLAIRTTRCQRSYAFQCRLHAERHSIGA